MHDTVALWGCPHHLTVTIIFSALFLPFGILPWLHSAPQSYRVMPVFAGRCSSPTQVTNQNIALDIVQRYMVFSLSIVHGIFLFPSIPHLIDICFPEECFEGMTGEWSSCPSRYMQAMDLPSPSASASLKTQLQCVDGYIHGVCHRQKAQVPQCDAVLGRLDWWSMSWLRWVLWLHVSARAWRPLHHSFLQNILWKICQSGEECLERKMPWTLTMKTM